MVSISTSTSNLGRNLLPKLGRNLQNLESRHTSMRARQAEAQAKKLLTDQAEAQATGG